ncbi:MAG: phosphoribosylformylglycinamidine synthase subunit PurL [Bacillota bacterium]|nr:phosphoribosylformylglycinamidine synthase subunit PurL [Bacillota bacterium]
MSAAGDLRLPREESWQEVGLTREEYRRIVRRIGREPNPVELGVFGLLWSEHCSYKSSRAFLGRLPSRGPRVVLGPGENAGVVDAGEGWWAAVRIESHNHPTAVDPYQGAATGVGGILRDVLATGARPVALLDSLRAGPPDDPRAARLLDGMVRGVGDYGNSVGVPTVGGELVLHPGYAATPLLNVMCVGLVRRSALLSARAAGAGNPVWLLGSATGRDGLHGASLLASRALAAPGGEEGSLRPAVQVGDPFAGKLLIEGCLALAEAGLVAGLNDLGAGGLAASAAEAAARAGTGLLLDLDRVPLRDPSLGPYEILLSETQERMLLVSPAGREAEVEEVAARHGLPARRVGRVTADGRLVALWRGEVVVDLPVAALTREAPRYRRAARRRAERPASAPPGGGGGLRQRLPGDERLRWLYEQYDRQVGHLTLRAPGFGGDQGAALLRLPGGRAALALAMAGRESACEREPLLGAALSVAAALRPLAALGAEPLGLVDALNLASPERPEVMGDFLDLVEGVARAAEALGVPVVGGNVSFYNEAEEAGVLPTPVVGAVGRVDDFERALRPPRAGDLLLLCRVDEGAGGEPRAAAGGEERLAALLERERRLQEGCREAVAGGLAVAAHAGRAGLAATLARWLPEGVEPEAEAREALAALEAAEGPALVEGGAWEEGRFLLAAAPERLGGLEALARRCGLGLRRLGRLVEGARPWPS